MPIELTMPRLSDTMEAGTVIKWNVKEGDPVRSGSVLADIETDKATMEMQCFDDGKLAAILVEPGKQVKVGTTIALIALEGEDVAKVKAGGASAKSAGGAAPAAKPAPAAPVAAAPAPAPAPAPASAPAPTPVVQTETRHGMEGFPTLGDDEGPRMRVSPVARRMAEEHGIDINSVQGTGPGGRVIKRDVEQAIENKSSQKSAAAATITPAQALAVSTSGVQTASAPLALSMPGRDVALTGMRQTIARRLVESKTTIPHYQVTMKFDMDRLLEMRASYNEKLKSSGIKLSVNDFLVRACALAMAEHPYFNASFAGDHVRIHEVVNVGVAISLPEEKGGGLVVGVIKDADHKSLRQISLEAKALAEKARTKGLSVQDMSDATFTISNLGMFGVEHFTAIINPPNSAILACGAAVQQPVVRDGQLVVGTQMQATLSLDHRVIDGAMAAQYLASLKEFIEEPETLVV
ncbi:MAG: Dihydrolipoyllysine-residue acetyltransferase component of pyruvate dehydrogenase complex [Planctomycetota bacterium]|jgi:pyruvate dehydrogenase E2 component (dihydrolipoamide acetyltransferase)